MQKACQFWRNHHRLALSALVLFMVFSLPIRGQAATLLRRGSTGESVAYLQGCLSQAGFDPGPADGIFGPRTENALRRFQSYAGIGVDGICGNQTWQAVDRILGVSRGSGPLRGRVIVIDPGHGGSDPGALSYWGDREKDFNLSIAYRVRRYLEESGAMVVMTRYGDYAPGSDWGVWVDELVARASTANSRHADIFVSIHGNAYPKDPGVSGVMGFYRASSAASMHLAQAIADRTSAASGLRLIDVQPGPYYVLNHASMPAALIEVGFLTNYGDVKLLRQNWFQDQAARGIARGIVEFFGR